MRNADLDDMKDEQYAEQVKQERKEVDAMPNEPQTTLQIISDDEIERIHANANFGTMTKRQVVNEGVLKYAAGYTAGHTMYTILREHALIRNSVSYKSRLTKKGQDYLCAMLREAKFTKLWEALNAA